MAIRLLATASALLVLRFLAGPVPAANETQLPPTYLPSGREIYAYNCAACHGPDAKGHGTAAALLVTPPPDLTTLSKRHSGKFPYDYVTNILEFGPGVTAHVSSAMPTWGPIFRRWHNQNERVVKKRIKRLCDYLASLQVH